MQSHPRHAVTSPARSHIPIYYRTIYGRTPIFPTAAKRIFRGAGTSRPQQINLYGFRELQFCLFALLFIVSQLYLLAGQGRHAPETPRLCSVTPPSRFNRSESRRPRPCCHGSPSRPTVTSHYHVPLSRPLFPSIAVSCHVPLSHLLSRPSLSRPGPRFRRVPAAPAAPAGRVRPAPGRPGRDGPHLPGAGAPSPLALTLHTPSARSLSLSSLSLSLSLCVTSPSESLSIPSA